MKYFDCDCLIGPPRVPLPYIHPDVDDLLSEMNRLGIDKALVRHRACLEADPEIGNERLLKEISAYENLLPAWYVTTNGYEGSWDPVEIVDRILDLNIRAAWTTLGGRDAQLFLEPWAAGKMLAALESHRIPLLLSYGDVPFDSLHHVLKRFSNLPVILIDQFRFGRDPVVYSLMEQHENLNLSINGKYAVHLGIETLCHNFNCERILFGCGYPSIEGGSSLANLSYADISEEARSAIAGDNLERILNKGER